MVSSYPLKPLGVTQYYAVCEVEMLCKHCDMEMVPCCTSFWGSYYDSVYRIKILDSLKGRCTRVCGVCLSLCVCVCVCVHVFVHACLPVRVCVCVHAHIQTHLYIHILAHCTHTYLHTVHTHHMCAYASVHVCILEYHCFEEFCAVLENQAFFYISRSILLLWTLCLSDNKQ